MESGRPNDSRQDRPFHWFMRAVGLIFIIIAARMIAEPLIRTGDIRSLSPGYNAPVILFLLFFGFAALFRNYSTVVYRVFRALSMSQLVASLVGFVFGLIVLILMLLALLARNLLATL